MKLWDIAIRQPVFMTMVLMAGIVMGIYSYFRMPVDVYPSIEFPVAVVTTIYPGASPTEVEDQVSRKLEDELATISGIDTVQSTSSEGLSNIILQFISICRRTRRSNRCVRRSACCATACPPASRSRSSAVTTRRTRP